MSCALRRAAASILVALAVLACSDPPAFDPTQPPVGPLTALPECTGDELPAAAEPIEEPPGADLPPGTTLSDRVDQGPLIQVTGFVEQTPVEIRVAYSERTDLELITLEDEIFEAEILVSDGETRTYVRATALCATGSAVIAVVAAEVDAQAVPVPDGAPGQAAPLPQDES